MARDLNLTIIPVVSKTDSPLAKIVEVKDEIARVLRIPITDVLECSGKTGDGVEHLLVEIIKKVPPPKSEFGGVVSSGTFTGSGL